MTVALLIVISSEFQRIAFVLTAGLCYVRRCQCKRTRAPRLQDPLMSLARSKWLSLYHAGALSQRSNTLVSYFQNNVPTARDVDIPGHPQGLAELSGLLRTWAYHKLQLSRGSTNLRSCRRIGLFPFSRCWEALGRIMGF